MDSSFHPIDSYWNYLKHIGLTLDSAALSYVTASLEKTDWDEPTSAIELNNVAVVALIEAEQSQDASVRLLYFEMAVEALNRGVELYGHPLCAAHLALVYGMTGETGQGMQMAFSTFIQSLMPAYVEESIDSGIVYLPPGNNFIDSRAEKLAEILGTGNGYTQSLRLLSEVLCYSVLVFYNVAGLRFLHLAAQLYPESAAVNLKLGISSLTNNQQEGLFYLHRARKLAPEWGNILQALYLAYRDLGQMESAKVWRRIGAELSQGTSQGLELYWTRLAEESHVSYVPFENQLLLAVEPSLRSIVTSVLITEGDWFEKEMEFWRGWIKPGMTVIDVGANVGVYTFSAALRVGTEGRVLAVEPFSGCVRCLQETCKINQLDWVKVCAGAASDHQGTARLALQAANELNQIVEGDGERMQQGTFEEVRCFTLDSLVEEEDISQVDLLKIDAEGHELKVLEGSLRLLSEFSPILLYENVAGSKGSNVAVADFLQGRGYHLFHYQSYLQQVIPIDSTENLSGRLNVIACPESKVSTLNGVINPVQEEETVQVEVSVPQPRVSYSYSPVAVFHSAHYLRHNQRRLEHLASLGLELTGATVLEVGAGIGDHTSFFLDRGCQVVSTEAREDNLDILRTRYPNIQVKHLDLNNPDPNFNQVFDIVYCYGLLYHLQHPVEAIEFMSRCCKKMLLLETCVSYGDEELMNPCAEVAENPSQAVSGQGCRPTRKWVYNQLKQRFQFVYMPITQPNHEEFPIDWYSHLSTRILTRSVYIASRQPLENKVLVEDIPMQQKRH